MPYVDLNTIHNPSTGTAPPASWGDAVRDNFEHFNGLLDLDQWTTPPVPTITQSVGVSKTIVHTRYVKDGRLVVGQYAFTISSSGTASNAITVTAPVNAAIAGNVPVGVAYHYNGSINIPLFVVMSAVGTFSFISSCQPMGGFYGTAVTPVPVVGGATTSVSSQLVSGNSLVMQFVYESAS